MSDLWEKYLKTRVPEFYQDSQSELISYLEVCGSILDELSTTIKDHDYYKDYKKSPESRLGLIAARFAFNTPAEITEPLLRGIIRDITSIHKTRGVEASIYWVFKILSWDVEIKQAWLPEPERFDPNIRSVFPSLYLKEISDPIFTKDRSYIVRVDDPYRVDEGITNFHINELFIFNDLLKIGDNQLQWIGDLTDTLQVDVTKPSTDVKRLGYRNFLYGERKTLPDGTYFDGGGYFDTEPTYTDLRIVGESYNEETVLRKDPKVLATPYIVIKVSGSDFDKFTQPYVGQDGEVYSYTSKESYKTVGLLLEYLLHNFTRPANVAILMISAASAEEEDDTITLNQEEDSVINISGQMLIGDYYVIGAPSSMTTNSITSLRSLGIGEFYTPSDTFIYSTDEFIYTRSDIVMNEVSVDGGTEWETEQFITRTPSKIRLTMDVSDSVNIYAKRALNSDEWVLVYNGAVDGDIFEVIDCFYLKFVSTTNISSPMSVDFKWLDQTLLDKPAIPSVFIDTVF